MTQKESLRVPPTFTLTTGVDAGSAFTGTNGDDLFFATDNTVNLGDNLAGGNGSDKLSIISAAATAFPVIKTVGIETYEIQTLVSGATLGLNNGTTDVTAINFVDSLNDATATFALSNLALTTGIGIVNSGTQVSAGYTTVSTSTADAITLTLNKSLANAALTTGGGVDQVNIVSNGTSNTLASIGDGAGSDLKKVSVTGAGNLTITAALEAQVTSFDASAASGKITVKTTNVASGQDTAVSSVDVTDITIKGGSASDSINVSANAADNEVSVDAGDGDDTVTIAAATAYSAATSTNAGDSIVGGAGNDTLAVAGNLNASDLSKAISGFEVLTFTADASGTDMSVNKLAINSFVVSGNGTDAVLTGLAANASVKITDGDNSGDLASISATIGTDTTSDVVNVSLESSTADVTATGYETVNLVSTKSATDSSSAANTAASISATDTKALNISGTQALTITTAALKASADVTSTSSGNVTATFSTTLKSYTGGAGTDNVTLAAGGLTASGTFNGGDGTKDILVVTASAAQNLGIINVSNFETLQIKAEATASTSVTVDMRNVTGLDTLTLVAGTGGSNTFTVDRLGASTLAVGTAISTVNTSLNSGSSVALKLTTTSGAVTTFNVDGSTTSVTVTADDGDATAAETGAAVTFAGTALATISVLGSDHVNLGTAAATVTKVDGSGSTGGFTVTASNATAASLIGSSVVDNLTGGNGADTITGGKGDDVLSGGSGVDTYVFAATGALNGTDTVTVVAGAGGDKLNFAAFLSGGSVEQNGGLGSAMVAFTSGSINDVNITNKVALYSDATEANIDSAAEIAALIEGAGDAFSLTSGGKAIIITGDAAGGANNEARIWYVDDSLGLNAGKIEADDVVQVAITNAAFDLDTLINSNFTFG